MRRPALSRILTIALLLVVLTVPFAWAKGPSSSRASSAVSTFSLADLLSRAWGGLVSLWMDNGCGIDPHGGCTAGPVQGPTTDNGCIADPHGGCMVAPATDNGCGADPSGRCLSGR